MGMVWYGMGIENGRVCYILSFRLRMAGCVILSFRLRMVGCVILSFRLRMVGCVILSFRLRMAGCYIVLQIENAWVLYCPSG